jgi:hypothetical protein
MRIHNHGLRSVALLLPVLLVIYTMPLSAAEGTSRATSIGQISASGAVVLRGVPINGDGTLFSGDRMNVGAGAYAKVALGAGPKIEMGAGSDVTVTRGAASVQVTMASGNIAFTGDGKTPIQVRVGVYEVTVPGNASGNVAYVGKDAFGVRVLTGTVGVRHTATKESYSVQKGSERLISLQTGDIHQPLAQLASAAPSAGPALPQTAGSGLSRGGWIAVIGTIAGAAAAIIILTTRNDDTDDDAATRLAQIKAIQNLNAIASTATATNTLAANVSSATTAALNTINASSVSAGTKATLQASGNAIIAKANAATAKIATLTSQISALQSTIANQDGAPTAAQQAQLAQLLADLESARNDANSALTDLNNLITQATAAGVTGLSQAFRFKKLFSWITVVEYAQRLDHPACPRFGNFLTLQPPS